MTNNNIQLSPPWFTLRNEIAAVLTSSGVSVSQLDTSKTPYTVTITVDYDNVAVAIASILPRQYPVGNTAVVPYVTTGSQPVTPIVPTSPQQLAQLVQTAFQGNPLLQQVVVQPIFPNGPEAVFPVFAAQVVQFPNDDLTDLYHNFNGVLANVARNVLAPNPGGFIVNPSTAQVS